jgi:hypothetical protein
MDEYLRNKICGKFFKRNEDKENLLIVEDTLDEEETSNHLTHVNSNTKVDSVTGFDSSSFDRNSFVINTFERFSMNELVKVSSKSETHRTCLQFSIL